LLNLKQYRAQLLLRNKCEENFAAQAEQADSLEENKEPEALPSILLVEDNEKDAKLVLYFLKNEPYRIEHVKNGAEAMSHLQQRTTDLILLDLLLPDMDGLEICRRVKASAQFRYIQIVIATCIQDLEHKIMGIELGADDYLIKPVESRDLKMRIKTLLKKKAYLDHLRTGAGPALNAAIIDDATGLYNRAYLKHFLDLSIQKSYRCNYPVSLLSIHIKDDTISGDFAHFIKDHIQETGLVARYDKEKIAIVLPYVDREGAINAAQRIEQAFSGYLLCSLKKICTIAQEPLAFSVISNSLKSLPCDLIT
jgi:PleD family two-component response regulator